MQILLALAPVKATHLQYIVHIHDHDKTEQLVSTLRSFKVPDNIKIVHNDEYNAADFNGYIDEQYFRLYHDLQSVFQRLTKSF